MRTTFGQLLASFLIACAAGALAQAPAPADSMPMTAGEVRKVDLETKKITLRHEEIKNLGMPQMTMVFQVKDPALLEKVKVGDRVRFTAEKLGGAYTVTTIEAAN
jgi:Cu(I)/Ag(I) efflux system protein CusF